MMSVLVNDRCLFRSAAGAAVYLGNVLSHWPGDAAPPVGFCRRHLPSPARRLLGDVGRKNTSLVEPIKRSRALAANLAPLTLAPLSSLPVERCVDRRPARWTRRMLQGLYDRSFRRAARNYDAVFEPNHLAIPTGRPTVATMLDLSVLEHPEWHPADRVAQWQTDLPRSLEAVTRWIAISRFTADRMAVVLNIPREKTTVIPCAARSMSLPEAGDLAACRERLGLPGRYMLHLGTLEPRKNIAVLLDAISQLPQDARRNCPLVLAGSPGWGGGEFWRSLVAHPMAGEVLWAGRVDDASMGALLAGALAVLVPSHYEGFGLPVLEAFAAGAPVICSTAGALREVAADAGEFAPSDDPSAWAAAMRRAIEDDPWRQAKIAAGRSRCADFSWEQSAAEHAAVIKSACE